MICVARAPGQKRSNSAPLGSTAFHPKGMLRVWGAWIGLETDAVGGNPKGESQPYCTKPSPMSFVVSTLHIALVQGSTPHRLQVRASGDWPFWPNFRPKFAPFQKMSFGTH